MSVRVVRLRFLLPRMMAIAVSSRTVLARRDAPADAIDHEMVHVAQRLVVVKEVESRWRGDLVWDWRYWTNGTLRIMWELEAYAVDIVAWMQQNPGRTVARVVEEYVDIVLASWLYRPFPRGPCFGKLPNRQECINVLTQHVVDRQHPEV